MSRPGSMFVIVILAAAAVSGPAAWAADERAATGFTRVHVPLERMPDVPLGAGRYVPMPIAEFEAAVSRLAGAGHGAPIPLAASARYEAGIDDRGDLRGSLTFEVASPTWPAAWLPLGPVDARTATARLGDGVGEAVLFALANGSIAIRTPSPGTYRCDFFCPSGWGDELRLPLLPSLATVVTLRLPADVRPSVIGTARALVAPAAGDAGADGRTMWRIEVGAATDAAIRIAPRAAEVARLAIWTEVTVQGRQAGIVSTVQPSLPWTPDAVELTKDAGLRVTAVSVGGRATSAWRQSDDGSLSIAVPPDLVGGELPMIVSGVAPFAADVAVTLPTLRPAAGRWGGGGLSLVVEPAFIVDATALDDACVLPAAAAARWPLPARPEPPLGLGSAGTDGAARLFFEQQSARGTAAVTLRRRVPRFDSTRVTTVDLSSGTVVGRAACEVRVVAGAAFEIAAEVMPGWFIDSVEAGEWDADGGGFVTSTLDRSLDWRLVRSSRGGELRIGLGVAATPSRRLGLRIVGHRDGVPPGTGFAAGDMDMVRLPGESVDSAFVEFRVPAPGDVEIDGLPLDSPPMAAKLTPLLEPGASRGRMPGGALAARGEARLVQRRPPLDARVNVRLTTSQGRLAETFTFTCLPSSGTLDTLVVDFSEPMGDALEWSLLEPAAGSIGARRLEASARLRADAARPEGVAESWLLELRPGATGPVTIQALRTVAFDEAVPVPLAWVEGASATQGTVLVFGGGAARPTLVNRRLRELPPAVGPAVDATSTLAEFAYGDPRSLASGADPAAEIAPGGDESRAWAWRESISCWCHDSGSVECETAFDLENHGREALTIAVPRGLIVDGVSIDGTALPTDGAKPAGGEIRLPLPPGLRRTRVTVHGTIETDARLGVWWVGGAGCTVDVPVLERQFRAMLPPELELVSPVGTLNQSAADWTRRLFNAEPRSNDGDVRASPGAEQARVGFRELPIDPARHGGGAGFFVVRRRLITSLSMLALLAAAACGLVLARRRVGPVMAAGVVAAIVALWLPPPFEVVVRSAWWGLLGAAVVARGFGGRLVAAGLAISIGCNATSLTAAEPVRVFITPGAEGTAFVPEPLFRLLSAGQAAAGAAVRVSGCRVIVGADATDSDWRMELDLEADQAGALVIDQADCGAAWRQAQAPAGVAVTIEDGGAVARLLVGQGRHRVVLAVRPGIALRGAVQEASLCLPPASTAALDLAAPGAVADAALPADRAWQCESAGADGDWRPAQLREAKSGPAFDVSRATRLRLLRPVDLQDLLAGVIQQATSSNQVSWLAEACRVEATFDVSAGREIVRTLVVRASAGLQPLPDQRLAVRPLGAGRFVVELPDPMPGRRRVQVGFEMPLVDPVGVFDVPGVWLEAAGDDERTVRLLAAGDLDVVAEPPGGASLIRPREGDAPGLVAQWRVDVVAAARAPAAGAAATARRAVPLDRQRASVTVRRRLQPPRIAQRLAIDFASDHVALRLQCQCDTAGAALLEVPIDVSPAAVVDRIAVWDESLGPADQPSPEPMDVAVSRPEPGHMAVVMQQPRAGRFRLEADLRLPFPPAARGRLPLARVTSAAAAPLALSWRTSPGFTLTVSESGAADGPGGEARTLRELSAADNPPDYILDRRTALPPVAEPAVEVPVDAGIPAVPGTVNRVEEVVAAGIHLALDGRGRAWGLARFDVVTSSPRLRLRLPAGFRLFDLLVDGREARAVPDGEGWEVPLHDVRWPRSLLVMIAGDVGAMQAGAAPVRLEPPRIEGLPCRGVFWTLDTPPHLALRIAAPAEVLDSHAWERETAAVRARLGELFAAADLRDDSAPRLLDFAALRSAGGAPHLEDEWQRGLEGPQTGPPHRIHARGTGDGSLLVRTVRQSDPGAGPRGLLTLGLIVVTALGWAVAGRLPAGWAARTATLLPWGLVAAGMCWLLALTPALPGGLLVVAGSMALIVKRFGRVAAGGPTAPFDSTRTFLAR